MKAATSFFLTIENGKLVVKYDGTHGGRITRVIRGPQDYNDFFVSKAHEAGVEMAALNIMGSSSLDFPDEYTKDKDVLALIEAIQEVR